MRNGFDGHSHGGGESVGDPFGRGPGARVLKAVREPATGWPNDCRVRRAGEPKTRLGACGRRPLSCLMVLLALFAWLDVVVATDTTQQKENSK
jgi:hypothetical protein